SSTAEATDILIPGSEAGRTRPSTGARMTTRCDSRNLSSSSTTGSGAPARDTAVTDPAGATDAGARSPVSHHTPMTPDCHTACRRGRASDTCTCKHEGATGRPAAAPGDPTGRCPAPQTPARSG